MTSAVRFLALASAATLACAACTTPLEARREIVRTDAAPAPIGPYSQAVRAGGALYVSGQIGLDPATGALAPGGIAAETRRALLNVEAVLAAGGCTARDVVAAIVYLADLADFAAMNAVYAEVFSADPPARATVGVAALPKGARVEIAVVAVPRS